MPHTSSFTHITLQMMNLKNKKIVVCTIIIFNILFFYRSDLINKILSIKEKIKYEKMMVELQTKDINDFNNALNGRLRFAAFACTPYNEEELNILPGYIDELNQIYKNFVIHLGDIKSGKSPCSEKPYTLIANIFQKSSSPVFFIPGDNEWNDCENLDSAWNFWLSHLYKFENNFPFAPSVEYQVNRKENFSWISNNVLIVGINLVGGRVYDQKEWDSRLRQNADWINSKLLINKNLVEAAIIFAHSSIKNPKNKIFKESFVKMAKSFNKPILYINGDAHEWLVETPFPNKAPNINQITLQGGKQPPIIVTVNPKNTDTFEFRFIQSQLDWN